MKKIICLVLAFWVVLASAIFATACSVGPSIDTIRTKFEESNYETEALPEIVMKIANVVDGFRSQDEDGFFTIIVAKLKNKKAMDAFIKDIGPDRAISIKKKLYVCAIMLNDSALNLDPEPDRQAVLDLFDTCFSDE